MVGHSFHVLKLSRWPLLVSFVLVYFFRCLLIFFKFYIYGGLLLVVPILSYVVVIWCKDIKIEGINGYHTQPVKDGLKLGFLTFIFTEIILFFRFFWAFFDSSISTVVDRGIIWPPYFITPLNPFDLPLINTMLLLFRRVLLTWAHILFYKNEKIIRLLVWTLILGIFFVYLQYLEYNNSPFTFRDRVYGSLFFRITGLHGSHVILGGVFLRGFLFYYIKHTYRVVHRLWIDLSRLYWHFVDVVWFFVWGFIYIWSY